MLAIIPKQGSQMNKMLMMKSAEFQLRLCIYFAHKNNTHYRRIFTNNCKRMPMRLHKEYAQVFITVLPGEQMPKHYG